MAVDFVSSGTKALEEGDVDVELTGLSLPSAPSQVVVTVRAPDSAAPFVTATVAGAPTADGFSVALSAPVPGTGYKLDWCAMVTSSGSAVPAGDTLAVGFNDLKREVADFLGYDPANLTEAQTLRVCSFIQSGLRQFYYPPKMDGVDENFEWSFLRMSGSVTTAANTGDYLLPDGFGRVAGNIYFGGDDMRSRPLAVVSVADVINARRHLDAGAPRMAAFTFADEFGQRGQRVKMLLAPVPDRAYTLVFSAEADTGMLDAETRPFPLGGPRFSELVLESCLAIAEQRANDEIGNHTAKFQQLLVSGIARDRKASAATFGYMGDRTPSSHVPLRPHVCGGFKITYRGQTW